MPKSLEDIIAFIKASTTKSQAFYRFKEAMGDYGYERSVYTLITDHPSIGLRSVHGLIGNYPKDWLDHYNARQYQQVDLLWRQHQLHNTPFFWHDAMEQLPWRRDVSEDQIAATMCVMNEAAEAGVTDGLSMSFINQHGEIAAVGLSRTWVEKSRSYNHMAEIFLLSAFFHEKFASFFPASPKPRMTRRELDVLSWAAENKKDSEIADLMGISSATVRFHWRNIFEKLEVNGRLPAVMKAVQNGSISPQYIKAPDLTSREL